MELLTRLQESDFAAWVASSPSLLAYPSILTLHTVGMAIVVGTCVVMDLRLLGVAADVPLSALERAPRLVWTGFLINAATGFALFTTDAEHKAMQTVFYVKLCVIFLALVVYARIRKLVFLRQRPSPRRYRSRRKPSPSSHSCSGLVPPLRAA